MRGRAESQAFRPSRSGSWRKRILVAAAKPADHLGFRHSSRTTSYASIRIHQERAHPGRVSGTNLANPDFLQWCEAFRVPVLAVENRADLPRLAEALRAPGPLAAVVRTSLNAVLPPAEAAPE